MHGQILLILLKYFFFCIKIYVKYMDFTLIPFYIKYLKQDPDNLKTFKLF